MENQIDRHVDRAEYIETARKFASVMERLCEVLEHEGKILYSARNQQLEATYKEKTNLLAEYAATLSALKNMDKSRNFEVPAEINAAIKQHAPRLSEAMKRNMLSLSVACEASEQIVRVIVNCVQQQRQTGAAYGVGKDGQMILAEPAMTAAAAVTYDARL